MRYITWNKPRTPTEQELKSILINEGMKPYITTLEKNQTTGVQQHKTEETRMVIMGKIEFVAEGRVYTLKPGDRIDIASNTAYIARNVESEQEAMICATKGKTVYLEIY